MQRYLAPEVRSVDEEAHLLNGLRFERALPRPLLLDEASCDRFAAGLQPLRLPLAARCQGRVLLPPARHLVRIDSSL